MRQDIARVLAFWLDEVGPAGWWRSDPALDQRIRSRFLDLWDDAGSGALTDWQRSPDGALALTVVLDQFPRNIHRGHPAAYQTDARARRVAKAAIARGFDLKMPELGRMFFYLPLEHSESLEDQERAVRLFLLRVPSLGPEGMTAVCGHRAVIRRFGRFPSRNAVLGRRDTAAERAYRAEGGYMSGAPGTGPG